MDLHVNGTKVDDWHNLALQTPSDLELKCRERLERICQFLEVGSAIKTICTAEIDETLRIL